MSMPAIMSRTPSTQAEPGNRTTSADTTAANRMIHGLPRLIMMHSSPVSDHLFSGAIIA